LADRLGIFAKAPQPGRVKTRLVPPLSEDEAATLYLACLEDVVQRAGRISPNVRIFYDPSPGAEEFFQRKFPGVELQRQSEGDLGRRLTMAAEALLAGGAARIALIGTDSPTLPLSYLSDGLAIGKDADVALGPTVDGGYYLVAVRSSAWPAASILFEGIAWSTEVVLEQTLERAREGSLRVKLLPQWYDIDRIADLPRAVGDAEPGSSLAQLLAREDWASQAVIAAVDELRETT
jgi:uncharacterized protein